MGNILSKQRKNNLELYLNDVYEKECVFKTSDEEVEFIQTGIEILAQRIVDWLPDENFCLDHGPQQEGKSLLEVYFPIKMDTDLQKFLYRNVPNRRSKIIKVGSFYEGTKNNFPDEFDFIFLLYCIKNKPCIELQYNFTEVFHRITTNNREGLRYPSSGETMDDKRQLYFGSEMRIHGPAYTVLFIYENGSGEKREIHVDLVPAVKIIHLNKKDLKEWCILEPFRKRIYSTGNVLHVDMNFSFTETELHFMRNVLSKSHVKLYRILKYLMNGHSDGGNEELIYGDGVKLAMSSYLIKVMIIYHHYECTNADSADIGACCLQVLDKICNLQETPTLLGTGRINFHVLVWLPIIFDMSDYLLFVQLTEDRYDYETYKMSKSVARLYLDLNLQGIWKVWWHPVPTVRPYTDLPVSYRP